MEVMGLPSTLRGVIRSPGLMLLDSEILTAMGLMISWWIRRVLGHLFFFVRIHHWNQFSIWSNILTDKMDFGSRISPIRTTKELATSTVTVCRTWRLRTGMRFTQIYVRPMSFLEEKVNIQKSSNSKSWTD